MEKQVHQAPWKKDKFWNRINSGDFDALEWMEETFGVAEIEQVK
jgi:hypothetical protein